MAPGWQQHPPRGAGRASPGCKLRETPVHTARCRFDVPGIAVNDAMSTLSWPLPSEPDSDDEVEFEVLEEDGLRKVHAADRPLQPASLPPPLCPSIFSRLPPAPADAAAPAVAAPWLQAINGYTWPGIEYGEPPTCKYTFFEVRACGKGGGPPAAARPHRRPLLSFGTAHSVQRRAPPLPPFPVRGCAAAGPPGAMAAGDRAALPAVVLSHNGPGRGGLPAHRVRSRPAGGGSLPGGLAWQHSEQAARRAGSKEFPSFGCCATQGNVSSVCCRNVAGSPIACLHCLPSLGTGWGTTLPPTCRAASRRHAQLRG
jgi:hypothetical protein